MKRLTIAVMLLIGVVFSVQGQEPKTKLTTCPQGWTVGPDADWKIFWNDALAEARQSGKKIFALSTGSDWCGWCVKLKKEVLTTETFKDFAKENLVLLYLDSPRKPLPEAQTLHNRAVCRELSLAGGVPCAAVFSADARRLGVLSGGGYTASNYVERLEKMLTEKGELPKGGKPSKIFTEGYVGLDADDADKKSQEELKKLATSIREKKQAQAEAERKKKSPNGKLAVREMVVNAVKWTYEIVDDGVILGNAGEGWVPAISNRTVEALIIPEIIDGKPVRGIGSGAFWRFTRLASLKLPSSLRSIGYASFEDCIGLTSIKIPSGVTNLSSRAFRNCTKLKSVEIPSSVKNIGNSAFSGCDGLTAISVEKDNASFCSTDGIMYDKSMTVVRCCPGGKTGTITIPDGVTRIGDSAFEGCKGLTSVEIPPSVEHIDDEAFRDCRGLSAVKIPSRVKRIGSQAFWGCSSLTSMAIPASVTDIAKVCYWGAFGCCGNLKCFTVDPANTAYSSRNGMLCSKDGKVLVAGVNGDVVIPSGVTHIEIGAFYGYEGLTSVTIPRGVVGIGSSAFSHCKGLTSVTIPSGVSRVGDQAFSWNPNLSQVDVPASVRKIGDHAFIACPKLTRIDIRGESVEIHGTAFGRDTPVGAKMPDLSKPVGPIHIVVDKDEGEIGNKGSVAPQSTKDAPTFESWQKGPSDAWFVKWDDAVAESKKTNKPIFVLSTGSDWCGWCIRLRKNVLSKPEFEAFAKKNLVLLYLDSPSKTPLCAEQKKHNQEVSRKLSLGGGVPNASVVTADGKKLGEIGGGGLGLEDYLKKLEEILKNSPKEDGGESVLPARQCAGKMPSQFMPTRGLVASFDYDGGKETNKGYGEVRRENDHVAFVEGTADYDGIYKYSSRDHRYKQGDRFDEDYVIPELNFDHFTVACSFRSAHTNDWGQYFFRIGRTSYSILEVRLSRGSISVYGRKLRGLSAQYVDKEWNWLVVSVDVTNREAWLSVNGCEPVSASLPDDFFWFIPSDRVWGDGFRRLTFGNWQCGERYCGQVDDLMVYDRALGRAEFASVCKRTVKANGCAGASFENPAPIKLPELRDDRWLFIPHGEQSVYWNGVIRTKDVSLKVRREADGLCVEPPGGIVDSVLDLALPVVDASGRSLSIVGIGSECDPYNICVRKTSLSGVRLPDTLKTIRKNAFAGCSKLESIVIPENVREIGSFAFTGCKRLAKLEIRAKDVTIAKDAFCGDTPVGAKMPDLSKPVGPIHVVVGKDAPVEKPLVEKCIAESVTENVHARTVRHCKASEVKKALDELTASGGAVKGPFSVTANDRLNKLIIVTDKSNLTFVDAVISQLDRE